MSRRKYPDQLRYQGQRLGRAISGSLRWANDFSSYIGPLLTLIVVGFLGFRELDTTGPLGTLLTAVLAVVVTWVTIVVYRFVFSAPFQMQQEARSGSLMEDMRKLGVVIKLRGRAEKLIGDHASLKGTLGHIETDFQRGRGRYVGWNENLQAREWQIKDFSQELGNLLNDYPGRQNLVVPPISANRQMEIEAGLENIDPDLRERFRGLMMDYERASLTLNSLLPILKEQQANLERSPGVRDARVALTA